ncbi:extensin precursor [Iris pallida]|uniref:Extensin n=1 Tax=Iris pallida TaxID=29817 RepID=A0AAX6IIR3_IRIPA|nr:extensin precursor [Iris pallida]KAJ6852813.1 extensin precursor [Iris pallida]
MADSRWRWVLWTVFVVVGLGRGCDSCGVDFGDRGDDWVGRDLGQDDGSEWLQVWPELFSGDGAAVVFYGRKGAVSELMSEMGVLLCSDHRGRWW